MKRALNEIGYFALIALALAGLFRVSYPRWEPLTISLASAFVVYGILTRFGFRWTLPRRRRHVPSIAVCFVGALLFSLATRNPEPERILVAASIGAFAFLFIAVKTGVPTHVGILVNAGSVSAHRTGDGNFDRERGGRVAQAMYDLGLFRDPLFVAGNFGVWPEHFEVSQEGSIAWYVNGPPGTLATIRFDQGFDPFSEPGGEASQYRALVPDQGPGIAVAGPVVRPSRGAYSIRIERPGDEARVFLVNGGGSQKKG
jgi:hypothetical protein